MPKATKTDKFRRFQRIHPKPITGKISAAKLVANAFQAYNSARLREGCELYAKKMLADNGLVGVSLSGALCPAGISMSCLIPLIKAGFIDWIVSTGANLYHDLHYALDMKLYRGTPFLDDVELHRKQIIRIYDILFDYDVLLDTDAYVRQIIILPEFQRTMGSDEFHHRLGRYICERERQLGLRNRSLISAAYEYDVPVFTSSPGDSSLGMNVAAVAFCGKQLQFDVNRDVNQTAAIVYDAKMRKKTSAAVMFGGGSPKNFLLQTEPQIQEVLGLEEKGHDYFFQITDARPDTGGLSGATPSEAVSWGKVDPEKLPDAVVCYCDSTIAVPLLTAYLLATARPRKPKRLYRKRDEMLARLGAAYKKTIGHQIT
jgi:deoxyhypusine synthase